MRSVLLGALALTFSLSTFAQDRGLMNPDISANFLGLLRRDTAASKDRNDPNRNGFTLQEAELQFFSDVDPYLRANALFAIAQEAGAAGYAIDPEEVFLETISLPKVTFRAGKMKLALGKHNQLHTHAFPFIDAPLIHQTLLGDEGLNELALSAAALLPTSWYSEIALQGFDPANGALFTDGTAVNRSGQIGMLAHWKNLFDLSDALTMEFGASGLKAKNYVDRTTSVFGADLTLKWRPTTGGKYHAFVWSTEYLNGQRSGRMNPNTANIADRLGGIASWVQYQFAERWWAQARMEYLGTSRTDETRPKAKQSLLLGFFPSEFSGFRLQLDRVHTPGVKRIDHAALVQYNITIGAHPAHAY